jgi:hypothetical protein
MNDAGWRMFQRQAELLGQRDDLPNRVNGMYVDSLPPVASQ